MTQYDFPPLVSAPPIKTVQEGALLTFTVLADDPDYADDISSFTANLSGLPSGHNATFTNDGETQPGIWTGTFSWIPAFNHAGTYTATFTATSNAQSGSDTTVITVTDYALSPGTLTLHLPVAGMKVEAEFFATACAGSGGLCETAVYSANQAGEVSIPLGFCDTNGICSGWWARVRLEFREQTSIAYWDVDDNGQADQLRAPLDLYPAANPADRLTTFTATGNPWHSRVLAGLGRIHAFCQQHYGYAIPTAFRLYHGGYSFSFTEGMAVDTDSSDTFANTEFVLAHEYAHGLQHYSGLAHGVPGCSVEEQEFYYPCGAVPCPVWPFTEGMADGIAEYFLRVALNETVYQFAHRSDRDCSPGILSPGNVTHFVLLMSLRDARAFMDTYRRTYGYRDASVQAENWVLYDWPRPATLQEYWDAWNGVSSSGTYHITVSHLGTFDASGIYDFAVNWTPTAVETPNLDAVEFQSSARVIGEPTDGVSVIRLRSRHDGKVRLRVFEVSGRLVEEAVSVESGVDKMHRLHLANRAAGVYLVRVDFPGGGKEKASLKVVNVK